MAELGPEPDHRGVRDGHHHRRRQRRDGGGRDRRDGRRTGAVTGITITNPGSGYTAATVGISGAGTGAAANAVVTTSGTVTAITVDANGGGAYKKPAVSITGGGATTAATATAYGGVDAVTLANAGSGYTGPTVDFDMPDDPNGTQAKAHADFDAVTGAITGVFIDHPGSGYSSAPGVVIRDGTLMDPIAGGVGASATATINVLSVALDTFGAGYTSAPTVTIFDSIGAGAGATATAAIATGGVTAINVTAAGTGYLTPGGIKKFQDPLPGLYDPAGPGGSRRHRASTSRSACRWRRPTPTPTASPSWPTSTRSASCSTAPTSPPSMPEGTLVRGYVQLETAEFITAHPGVSRHYPLTNERLNGDQGRHPERQRTQLVRRDPAAVARPDHRGHQEQAGAHRLPQPPADRFGRQSVHARPTVP